MSDPLHYYNHQTIVFPFLHLPLNFTYHLKSPRSGHFFSFQTAMQASPFPALTAVKPSCKTNHQQQKQTSKLKPKFPNPDTNNRKQQSRASSNPYSIPISCSVRSDRNTHHLRPRRKPGIRDRWVDVIQQKTGQQQATPCLLYLESPPSARMQCGTVR